MASEHGRLDVVHFLVEHGADPNARGMYLVIIFYLTKLTEQNNIPVEQQQSALELASYKGNLNVVHFLVEHGVDPNARGMYLVIF